MSVENIFQTVLFPPPQKILGGSSVWAHTTGFGKVESQDRVCGSSGDRLPSVKMEGDFHGAGGWEQALHEAFLNYLGI